MSASPESAEVVSIRSHTGYRADYQGLASAQVSAARAKLGLSFAEFADRLGSLVGWSPSPAVVERWARGSTAAR